MPLPSRIFPTDEELGKRDDDRRRSPNNPLAWKSILRLRRRRIFLGVVGVFLVWLFIHYIPTDLGSVDERMGRPLRPGHTIAGVEFGYRPPVRGSSSSPGSPAGNEKVVSNRAPTGPPPRPQTSTEEQDHYYAGPIKFYNLAKSLQSISRTAGYRIDNRNILFAASNLRSAANLMPLACEMARVNRNYVHLVLMGRETIPLEDILQINGVDKETCSVYFHDGRPDYSEYSTDARAEVSVAGALGHVNTYMHPQAIITDDSAVEDIFFVKGMRTKAKELERPIIEIPKDKYEDFLWITHLDSGGLTSWHKPNVNILIHAPAHASGSLLRLLHSIKSADYTGLALPDITIDLPADVEPFVRDYLRDFQWPPKQHPSGPRQKRIKVHHRISTTKTTTESNALRFLESFYPVDDHSHVLLLSAQTELSPLYYHYLMFHMLEHRYSASGSEDADNMFGIVLASPHAYLNGSTPFSAPTVAQSYMDKATDTDRPAEAADDYVPFLWQAPNADAALVFGDIWIEVHDYIKNRLRASHDVATVQQPPSKPEKLISETQPGWLEYMLELMRARGWNNLYPAQRGTDAWATVHQDLFQKPEEFLTAPSTDTKGKPKDEHPPDLNDEEPFLRGEPTAAQLSQEQRDTVQHSQPLHALLSAQGDLPELADLPRLNFAGDKMPRGYDARVAKGFRTIVRKEVGGCRAADAAQDRTVIAGKTNDLFCFVDEDELERIVDTDEQTAQAIVASDVAEPAPYAVKDVKGSVPDEEPDSTKDESSTKGAAEKTKPKQEAPKEQGRTEASPGEAKEQGKVGASSGETKQGGGTMKAVVEDLPLPQAKVPKSP